MSVDAKNPREALFFFQGAALDLGAYEEGDSVRLTGYDLRYQWYAGDSGITTNPVNGATSSIFTTPALVTTGKYWVRVGDGIRYGASATATIAVFPQNAAIASALDSGCSVSYFTWGDQPWSVQSTTTHDGVSALKSGAITHTQPIGVSGISYGAEWSTTLLPGSWTSVSDTGTPPQHTFSVPIASKTQLYMRLKVSEP